MIKSLSQKDHSAVNNSSQERHRCNKTVFIYDLDLYK